MYLVPWLSIERHGQLLLVFLKKKKVKVVTLEAGSQQAFGSMSESRMFGEYTKEAIV